LSYGQSSSSKAGLVKPILVNLANQVQQKDAPIKESEGPIVIDNLDQSDMEKISRGTVANDHEAQIAHRFLRTSKQHGALQVCRERKSANSSVLITISLSKKG